MYCRASYRCRRNTAEHDNAGLGGGGCGLGDGETAEHEKVNVLIEKWMQQTVDLLYRDEVSAVKRLVQTFFKKVKTGTIWFSLARLISGNRPAS